MAFIMATAAYYPLSMRCCICGPDERSVNRASLNRAACLAIDGQHGNGGRLGDVDGGSHRRRDRPVVEDRFQPRCAMGGVLCRPGADEQGQRCFRAFGLPVGYRLGPQIRPVAQVGAYAAAALSAAIGFGWELHALQMLRQMASFHGFTLAAVRSALDYYLTFIFHDIGWVVCALILIGMAACARSVIRREGAWELWVSMAATGFSVIVFHVLLPHPPDGRYVLAGIAPLLVFVAPAAKLITSHLRLGGIPTRWRVPLALSGVLVIFLGFFFQVPKMPRFGFHQCAGWLGSHPLPGLRYLIISDPNGEGAFISEVASPINRSIAGPRVMRASKLLFVSDWNGHKYQMLYQSAEEALADIERMGISYIIVDTTNGLSQLPHWEQVRQMVRQFPERLRLVDQIPAGAEGARSLEIYRVSNYANPPVKQFEFQTFYTRGGFIRE